MHVDVYVDAICAELRRCFDISSMDELDKMTKDQCLSILHGAKAANFQITDYYKRTIVVYLHAKVILENGDWNENKIVIYADSSHTKKSLRSDGCIHHPYLIR